MPPSDAPATAPRVSVLIAHLGGKPILDACLKALDQLDYPKDAVEVIVIDNGATDDSLSTAESSYPGLRILTNDRNNYCRANNLGIANSTGEYVAFLNNDTRVDPRWAAELVAAMEADPALGCVGSVVLGTDGAVQSAGHRRMNDHYWEDFADPTALDKTEPYPVESLCGCAVLYRRSALEQIGEVDEDFQMYVEDVDLALRLADHDWRLACVPTSIVHHEQHGTATHELARFQTERNRLLLLAKRAPKELAGALAGNGYFTRDRDYGRPGLVSVTGEAIAKLLEHQPLELARSVVADVLRELGAIVDVMDADAAPQLERLRDEIAQRDHMLRERAEYIDSLKQTLVKKDEYVTNLESEVKARDEMIAIKDEYVASLEREIKKLRGY